MSGDARSDVVNGVILAFPLIPRPVIIDNKTVN
jgi:hypothetical protein